MKTLVKLKEWNFLPNFTCKMNQGKKFQRVLVAYWVNNKLCYVFGVKHVNMGTIIIMKSNIIGYPWRPKNLGYPLKLAITSSSKHTTCWHMLKGEFF